MWASAAAALARMSSLNDSILVFFLTLPKFMINAILIKNSTGKENQAREIQELENLRTKINDGEFEELLLK